MEEKELINWIRLINTENIGPITFYKLLNEYQNADNALAHISTRYKLFPLEHAKQELKLAKAKGIQIISYHDEAYPANLKHIADTPPLLYVLGNAELLNHPLSLSIVGARNASINGRKLASRIAFDLTNNDVLIVSGMARGIDTAAHKGAMYAQNQQGPTIAVLGTGVDIIYPPENKDLYAEIAAHGVLISEFPLSTDPQTNNFPRRNRIVSALSSGTLVVEANLNSGSLITARLALEQNRDVFAVPGSPLDGRSLGTNKLIKDGAILVEDFNDILSHLDYSNCSTIKPLCPARNLNLFDKPLDKVQNNVDIPKHNKPSSIIEYLDFDGVYVDEIIRISNLSSAEVAMQILEMEMEGTIERCPGNKVALIKKGNGKKQ